MKARVAPVLLAVWLGAGLPVGARAAGAEAAPPSAEQSWAQAGAEFDRLPQASTAAVHADLKASLGPPPQAPAGALTASTAPAHRAPGTQDSYDGSMRPEGFGPISREPRPNYFKGLAGGLFGLILAPLAFAYETLVGALTMPVRLVHGLARGDGWSALEPLRTAKNILQDAVLTGLGMVSLAAAPVWNAIYPSRSTDFMVADDRLIFVGGPFEWLIPYANGTGHATACAPSWHTIFYKRDTFSHPGLDMSSKAPTYMHEKVHNVQWRDSFLWEKQNHDYVGKDYSRAEVPLNW